MKVAQKRLDSDDERKIWPAPEKFYDVPCVTWTSSIGHSEQGKACRQTCNANVNQVKREGLNYTMIGQIRIKSQFQLTDRQWFVTFGMK